MPFPPYDLTKHFDFFDLAYTASLDTVDARYFLATNSLFKTKHVNPEYYRAQQVVIDNHYYQILQYFIHKSPSRPDHEITYDDVEKHRDESPTTRVKSSQTSKPPNILEDYPMTNSSKKKRKRNRVQDRAESTAAMNEPAKPKRIIYKTGNLFDGVVDGSIIIHSTNCLGSWGAGFASELKRRCPAAFEVYYKYCAAANTPGDLATTCLLIRPQSEDISKNGGQRWYIVCLFTSVGYGNHTANKCGKSAPKDIVRYTDLALTRLHDMLDRFDGGVWDDEKYVEPGALCSPRINAGLFGVPWEETSKVIEEHLKRTRRSWTVFA